MDYQNMTKAELIEYINEAKKKRAFTYEDQMKLMFLDSAPFTIWASDRNCVIKFWEGQCESLYGYKKEEALGRDFVNLFVAPDEQKAARQDQVSIIDNGEIFHNIANDIGKNGNTLHLLTNCWRYKAPGSDEYWNFEMGLVVDFFKQEEARLEQIIAESKRLKEGVSSFIDLSKRYRDQFLERRKSLRQAMQECDQKAISLHKRAAFISRTKPIRTSLEEISENINRLIDISTIEIQNSAVSVQCESLTKQFRDDFEEIMFLFEELVADFQEISMDYLPITGDIAVEKEAILKDLSTYHSSIYDNAYHLKKKIDDEIDSFRINVTTSVSSVTLAQLERYRDAVATILKQIGTDEVSVYERVHKINSLEDIVPVRKFMSSTFEKHEASLSKIMEKFRGAL